MAISSFATGGATAGSNDFTLLVGTSGNTTYVLDRVYLAGSYKVTFANGDTTYDIYAIAKNGTNAGYTKTGVLNVSADFNEVVILGAATSELISFSYQGAAISPTSAGDVATAGAYITSVSDSTLVSIDDSTTITGGNFAPDVEVAFIGQNSTALAAKSVVRSSSTSLIATRPDTMPPAQSPYSVRVLNPGIAAPTGANGHILSNSVTAGGTPTWVTTTLPDFTNGTAYSQTLSATDADGSVTYSIVSGTLPTGLSLNSTTGVISGTPSGASSQTVTFRATDNGGNFLNQTITITKLVPPGQVLFTSSGTWTAPEGVTSVSVVAVGGGGGGIRPSDNQYASGSGGGALGWKNNISVTPGQSYTVVVGAAGGPGDENGCTDGGASYFINTSTVRGGGGARGIRAGGGTGGRATYTGDGGGNGGIGGQGAYGYTYTPGGGGGAGGYAGQGGDGGYAHADSQNASQSGSGGGGSGSCHGGSATQDRRPISGGGVGLLGQGANGAGSPNASTRWTGRGGSGGSDGQDVGPGGSYGGGAGGSQNGSPVAGGPGAVRIIWGNATTTRAFPSTNTGDM